MTIPTANILNNNNDNDLGHFTFREINNEVFEQLNIIKKSELYRKGNDLLLRDAMRETPRYDFTGDPFSFVDEFSRDFMAYWLMTSDKHEGEGYKGFLTYELSTNLVVQQLALFFYNYTNIYYAKDPTGQAGEWRRCFQQGDKWTIKSIEQVPSNEYLEDVIKTTDGVTIKVFHRCYWD